MGGRPFTGAWIETSTFRASSRPLMVAPSRGRGLKRLQMVTGLIILPSPLHGGVD